ncbi:MAG: Ig-like domain-containing protein [Trueperaceae bacterium]|nr:Ig-like domain-containing protein [Trueperaceae bacterium]
MVRKSLLTRWMVAVLLLLLLAACGRGGPQELNDSPQLGFINLSDNTPIVPSSFSVTLRAADDGRVTNLRYRIDDGPFQSVTLSARPVVSVTNLMGGPHTLTVVAEDDDGLTTELSRSFIVDATPPRFESIVVQGQNLLNRGDTDFTLQQGEPLFVQIVGSDDIDSLPAGAGTPFLQARLLVNGELVATNQNLNEALGTMQVEPGQGGRLDALLNLDVGIYELGFVLVDIVGNTTVYNRRISLEVVSGDGPVSEAPDVFWTAPFDGQSIIVGETVPLRVEASDPDEDGFVGAVRFFVGGTLVATDSNPNDGFSADLDTSVLGEGSYELRAEAIDNTGVSAEATISINLVAPGTGNTPPDVFFTQPLSGQRFELNSAVSLSVSASDPDPNDVVTRVRFFVTDSLVAEDSDRSDGFTATLDTRGLSAGTYELRAIAIDGFGATTETSVSIDIFDPEVPTVAPNLFWTEPFDNQTFEVGQVLPLSVNASDDDGTVTEVRFFVGNTLLNTDNTPNNGFTSTLDTALLSPGDYELRAEAQDNDGNVSDATISLTLLAAGQGEPNEAPEAFWVDPFAGQQFEVGSSLPLVVEATDPDGTISGVRFFANNTLVGNDTTPGDGFGTVFDTTNLTLGSYELRAVATDDDGARGEAIISIELVAEGGGTDIAPEVFWNEPFDTQQFQVGDTIDLVVSASDADGTVSQVRFFVGNTLISSDDEPADGFRATLNTGSLSEGSYDLRAQAIDNDGNTADATISIELAGGALQDVRVVWLEPLGTQVGGTVPLRVRVEEPATSTTLSTQAVSRVAFFAGDVELGQGSPVGDGVYSYDWNTQPFVNQDVTLRARATTDSGGVGEAVRTVTVSPSPPSVAITSPADGETVSGTISVVVDPRDTLGISRVVLIVNGTPGPEKTSAPYTFSLDTTALANGAFTLQAFAENTEGIGAFSPVVNLTSDNLLPPQLSITEPADGAEVGVIFDVGINILDRDTPYEYVGGITVEVFDFRGSPVSSQTISNPPANQDFSDTLRFDLGGNAGDNYTVRATAQVRVNPGQPDEVTVNLRDEVRIDVVIPSDLPPALVVFAPSRSGATPIFDTAFYSVGNVTDEDGSITALETRMVCDACGNAGEPINALLRYDSEVYGTYAAEFATDATPLLPEAGSYKLRVTAIDDTNPDLRNIQELGVIVDRLPYATQAIADSFAELRAANLFLSTSFEDQDVFPARAVWTADLSGVSNDVSYVFIYRTGIVDEGGTAQVVLQRGTAPAGTSSVAFTATFTTDQIGVTPNVSVVLQDLEVGPQVLLDPVAVSVSEPPDETGGLPPGDGTGQGSIVIDWLEPSANQEFVVGDIIDLAATASGENPIEQISFSFGTSLENRSLVGTDTTPSDGFTAQLDSSGVSEGTYTLYARATDSQGNRAERTLTISLVAPAGGGGGEPAPGDGTGPGSIRIDWVQPRAGVEFFVGDPVPLQVEVSGDNPTDSVRFSYSLANADEPTPIGTDTTRFDGFTELLNTQGLIAGDYTLFALATDSEGNRAERSKTITVSERGEGDPAPGDGTGPGGIVIDWLNPQNDDELTIGDPVSLQVSATADVGNVATVRFSYSGPNGPVTVGTDSADGDDTFSRVLDTTNLDPGTYTLTALATTDSDEDGDGNNDQASRSIGVFLVTGGVPPGDGTGPGGISITWQSPQDGATFDVGTSLSLSADVTGDNAISGVDFSYSTGGGSFVPIGSDTDGPNPFTTTFNTSGFATGDYILRAIATDSQNNQAQRSITITLANTAPSVTWLNPAEGDQLNGTVSLQVEATDPGGIQSVEFFANGSRLGIGTQSLSTQQTGGTFSFSWDSTTVSDGQTILTARVTDNFGNTTEESISVFVANVDQTPPTVSWETPFDGQQFEVSTAIQLTADATDNSGTLAPSNLSFAVDGQTLTGSVSRSGSFFSTTWNAPDQTGFYDLTVTATDPSGNSASATITVQLVAQGELDETPPTVSWAVPNDGATVQGSSVTLEADASDTGSGIAFVEFFYGSTLIDTGAAVGGTRYRANWDSTTVSDGTYVLTARALDQAGNEATDTITVTVSNAPQVTWVSPADGATIAGITTLQVDVDAQRSLSSVRIALPNQTVSATLNTATGLYEFTWNATSVSPGNYTLTATATDSSGATGSANRAVVVAAPFSITNPADGATVNETDGVVDVVVSPSNSLTGITDVTGVTIFFNGDDCEVTPTGTGTGPYTFAWDPSQTYPCHNPQNDSNRVITAQVAYTTNAGSSATFTTNAITVSYSSVPPVTVSWQSPPTGALLSGTVDLVVAVTNTDSVTFRIGGQSIGTVTATGATSETVTLNWDSSSVADGPVTIEAVATATFNGQVETSDPATRSFTVDNTAPIVTIVSVDGQTPTDGLAVNETIQIVAEISDATSGVAGATLNGNTISPDTNGGTTYTVSFDTKQQVDGTFTFTFAATDVAGNQNSDSVSVLIDNTPPLASINLQDVDINAGGTTNISSSQDLPLTVVINSNDNGGSGIREVRVELSTNGGAFNTITTVVGGRQTVSLDSSQLSVGSNYRIRAIASDNAGNEPSIVELNTTLNITD